jgi:stage II sporulation protein D
MNITHKQLLGWSAAWLAALAFMAVLIPGLLVRHEGGGAEPPDTIAGAPLGEANGDNPAQAKPVLIPVYLSKQKAIETVPLEDYVRGVVAAEMPADFELEAMKAQAMAARTYMVRRILDQDFSNVPVKDAWVTDTIAHQAYVSEAELQGRLEVDTPEAAAQWEKLNRAVQETKDLILTYDDRPINATFFSTSNGYTENSEDYWGDSEPYLRSVPSPWDEKLSPRFRETVSFSYKDVLQKLGVSAISTATGGSKAMKIVSRTAGHRIKTISIGGKTFSGKEVRERLGLNSSDFSWVWQGSEIRITTTGYGHGVGMSQWGADGMAKEGKTAEQIVKYFYRGISIAHASSFLAAAKS